MYEIETFEHAGKTIRICIDPDPMNPRKEYENLATFACWHSRLNLGDRQISRCSEEDFRADAEANGEDVLALLPLYLYQHSGITISNSPFSCSFDSGQVGWAYVSRAGAEKMGCVGYRYDYPGGKPVKVGTWDESALQEAIRGETETYDQYLIGQVYGYEVIGHDGDCLDSCWGFFGEIEYVRSEARSAAEGSEDPAVTRQA